MAVVQALRHFSTFCYGLHLAGLGQDPIATMVFSFLGALTAVPVALIALSLLVTLYRCPEMELSSAALFKGSFTEFCGGGRDSVLAGQRRCPVQGLFEFEDRESAFTAYDRAIERITATREEESE